MALKCRPQPVGVTSDTSMRISQEKETRDSPTLISRARLNIPSLNEIHFLFGGWRLGSGISAPRLDPCDVDNQRGFHFNFRHGWLFNWTPACPFANDSPQALRSAQVAQGRPEQIVWGLVQIQGKLFNLSELFLLVWRNWASASVCLSVQNTSVYLS